MKKKIKKIVVESPVISHLQKKRLSKRNLTSKLKKIRKKKQLKENLKKLYKSRKKVPILLKRELKMSINS